MQPVSERQDGTGIYLHLRVRLVRRSLNFLIYLMLSAALGPGVYSASNRNEYHKVLKMFIWKTKNMMGI
jgi:hypothetical protein